LLVLQAVFWVHAGLGLPAGRLKTNCAWLSGTLIILCATYRLLFAVKPYQAYRASQGLFLILPAMQCVILNSVIITAGRQ